MSLTPTIQGLIDWGRLYIPDPKTRNKSVRGLEIGRTSLATGVRESFYLKHSPTGSIFIYVEPYTFSASSTLNSLGSGVTKFLYNATLLKITFPNGVSDPSIRPFQFKPVLADYEYLEKVVYVYSDLELAEFLPASVQYLNNTFEKSYTTSGTISTLNVTYSSNLDKELISKSLAILVRKSFIAEQKRRGLGIRFSAPGHSIDSVQQLKDYQNETRALEAELIKNAKDTQIGAQAGGLIIDVYSEPIVEA